MGRWFDAARVRWSRGDVAVDSTARQTIHAWLGAAEVSATVGPARLAVGATRLSDDDAADGTELDVSAGAPVADGTRVDVGASLFHPADRLGTEAVTRWADLMLTAGF